MPFPTSANADSDDPTTQIAWPSRTSKRSRRASDEDLASSDDAQDGADPSPSNGKRVGSKDQDSTLRRLSTLDLINLSVSMAGSQVAWTVELGYVVMSNALNHVPLICFRQIWNTVFVIPGSLRDLDKSRMACWSYQWLDRAAYDR